MATLERGEQHQKLLDELLAEVRAYTSAVDLELVTRAFRYAAEKHDGQQRQSGSPFIEHPVGAARICAELRLDEQTIAAALLHDVVEDTETDIEDVRQEFGDEIARLVEGVTKLTRISFQSREQAEAENYRKMIVAMSEDVRVILIKLADRLHNMRTIEYLGKQKQIQKAKETHEIYALTAMRVIVERDGEEGTRDCYGALGLIHSLWKPMPGRFKDYVAMPKFNGYRSLHTTVIGPEGRPLEIQVRTREMQETAELGVAAHWAYKRGTKSAADEEWMAWVKQLMDAHEDDADASEFVKSLRADLFDEEVFVFTPKGAVKTLPAGATPIDFAYAVHTDVGHRTVGAKVNGRIVPLHYKLRSGDRVEILTSKAGRGPSRDWLSLAASSRAKNKIHQFFSGEQKEDLDQRGPDAPEHALKVQNLPYRKLAGSADLAGVFPQLGYKKADRILHS